MLCDAACLTAQSMWPLYLWAGFIALGAVLLVGALFWSLLP
jgi:hypothetical protein